MILQMANGKVQLTAGQRRAMNESTAPGPEPGPEDRYVAIAGVVRDAWDAEAPVVEVRKGSAEARQIVADRTAKWLNAEGWNL